MRAVDVKPGVRELSAEEFSSGDRNEGLPDRLKELFDKYGSDKATVHNYHLIYATILRRPKEIRAVLEIGLGTNDVTVTSHMGEQGKPGASIRAFRDFLPNAQIYGADIDRKILFEDERIKTYFVDQTELSSFDALASAIPGELDLMIDDGLHAPNANIAALAFGLTRIKVGGWVVIEDIRTEARPVWQAVGTLLPERFESYLFATKAGPAFAVRRIA
jgi:hypothetical protein